MSHFKLVFLCFIITACNSNKENVERLIFKLNDYRSCSDEKRFYLIWQDILSNEDEVLGLIKEKLEADTMKVNLTLCWSINLIDDKSPKIQLVLENELAYCYLLCAIYYKDYNFANYRYLVKKQFVKYPDGRCKEKITNLLTTEDEKKQALNLIKKWFFVTEGLTLDEIRENRMRPFMESNLYWCGEPPN